MQYLRKLGNNREFSKLEGNSLVSSFPPDKFFALRVKKKKKNRHQTFLVLSDFPLLFYFLPKILSRTKGLQRLKRDPLKRDFIIAIGVCLCLNCYIKRRIFKYKLLLTSSDISAGLTQRKPFSNQRKNLPSKLLFNGDLFSAKVVSNCSW